MTQTTWPHSVGWPSSSMFMIPASWKTGPKKLPSSSEEYQTGMDPPWTRLMRLSRAMSCDTVMGFGAVMYHSSSSSRPNCKVWPDIIRAPWMRIRKTSPNERAP